MATAPASSPSSAYPAEQGRIVTVPNVLTVGRLLCLPVFVWLLARPDRAGWYPAALLLGALGVTDFLDGYIARHFNQVSTLGKVLDPVADRLLIAAAAVGIVVVGAVPTWLAVIVLVREGLVAVGTLVVAAAGGRRLDVQWAGKAGTLGLMFALPLFLIGHANDVWRGAAEPLAWAFAVPALVLGWYAAATYVPMASDAIREARTPTDGGSE